LGIYYWGWKFGRIWVMFAVILGRWGEVQAVGGGGDWEMKIMGGMFRDLKYRIFISILMEHRQ
jgi:hypothetical protein